jgi:hypothetical protein
MSRLIAAAVVLVAMLVIALLKVLVCLCSPEVGLHLILAGSHAVTEELLPLQQVKHLMPLVVVGTYLMLAALYFVRELLRRMNCPRDCRPGEARPPEAEHTPP